MDYRKLGTAVGVALSLWAGPQLSNALAEVAAPAPDAPDTAAPPAPSAESARLNFVRNPTASGWQSIRKTNEHCFVGPFDKPLISVGRLLHANVPGPVNVPANQDIYLEATAWLRVAYCNNFVQFRPEGGHTYDLQQLISSEKCALVVTDQATGKPPPDLRFHHPPDFIGRPRCD